MPTKEDRPQYIVERWQHGWLICSALGIVGIPAGALMECQALFPKNAVICAGIAHHYNASGSQRHVIAAIADLKEKKAWEIEITDSLTHSMPETRWWLGIDVGQSSAAIFSVLASDPYARWASEYAKSAVPRDADDVGRCVRLLELFPTWRNRLHEVSEAFPDTKWPEIVRRWQEIEGANSLQQNIIIGTI